MLWTFLTVFILLNPGLATRIRVCRRVRPNPGPTTTTTSPPPACENGDLGDYCDPGRCDCTTDPNSECTGNTCSCATGYLDIGGVCKPPCENGDLGDYCDPGRCDCTTHVCTNNTCSCVAGQVNIEGACEPECDLSAAFDCVLPTACPDSLERPKQPTCSPSSSKVCCGPISTKQYIVYNTPMVDWEGARYHCEQQDQTLAMFKTDQQASDFNDISQILIDIYDYLHPDDYYWIGAKDIGDGYEFIDGTPLLDQPLVDDRYVSEQKKIYWSDRDEFDSPDDANNCMAVRKGTVAGIRDYNCDDTKKFVCQKIVE